MLSYLSKQQVIQAIERKNPPRIPLMIHFANYGNTPEPYLKQLTAMLDKVPNDFIYYMPVMPGYDGSTIAGNPGYRWIPESCMEGTSGKALDANTYLKSWDHLDTVLAQFPDPEKVELFSPETVRDAESKKDHYIISHFNYAFYERLWSLRGMENALMDLYLYPDEVKALLQKFCDFYKVIIRRSREEIKADALFVSDDMGAQASLMFSPQAFREFFKPMYRQIVEECHKNGMHFWLHSCGNITAILDDLIEIGVDVLHPIQKFAMEQAAIAKEYKGKICFWLGMDMQHMLPEGTAEEIRGETKALLENFHDAAGGVLLGAGNGFTEDIPLENIQAFLDAAVELCDFETLRKECGA